MILQRGIEAIRREAMAKTQQKLKEQKHFQSKVDALSKHNVGGYYDLRAIAKSKQFKEQKNFYDTDQALAEFEDMLTQSRLITHKNKYLDYLKTSGKSEDSFQVRTLGKFISELVMDIKIQYEIKD